MIPYNNEHNRSATSEDSIQPKTSSITTQKFAENATTIPSGTMQPPSSSKLNIISNLSNQRSSTHQQVHTSPSNKDDKREASKPNPSTKPYVEFLSKLGVHILFHNNRSNSVNIEYPMSKPKTTEHGKQLYSIWKHQMYNFYGTNSSKISLENRSKMHLHQTQHIHHHIFMNPHQTYHSIEPTHATTYNKASANIRKFFQCRNLKLTHNSQPDQLSLYRPWK